MAMHGWSMLWQTVGDGRLLVDEITLAVERYEQKNGQLPEIIYVHQEMLQNEMEWNGIPVLPGAKPHGHLFLCQEPKREANCEVENEEKQDETNDIQGC